MDVGRSGGENFGLNGLSRGDSNVGGTISFSFARPLDIFGG